MLTLAAPLEARATARLAGFPGFLRANGFMVGGGDAVTVLQAAQCVGVLDSQLLRWSLRALLCGRCDEWRRFDGLFDAWFLPPNRWQRPMQREAAKAQRHGEWPELPAPSGNETDRDEDLRPRRAASRRDALSSTDFRFLTERDSVLE